MFCMHNVAATHSPEIDKCNQFIYLADVDMQKEYKI